MAAPATSHQDTRTPGPAGGPESCEITFRALRQGGCRSFVCQRHVARFGDCHCRVGQPASLLRPMVGFVMAYNHHLWSTLSLSMPNMPLCESRLAVACLSSHLPSSVSECAHQFKALVRHSSTWLFFSHDSPSNSALTLGALIVLIAFIMIPKKYRSSSSSAPSPDSSAPSSFAKEYKGENGRLQRTAFRPRKVWWIVLATATVLLGLILGLSLGLTLGRERHGGSPGPIVDLGYSAYQGNTYSDGVSQWLGIRYAAPPTGDLRFAAPQDPIENSTLQEAIKVC